MPEKYQNKLQDQRLSKIENHIEVINGELGNIKTDVAQIKSDVCWLKKTYWVVVTAVLGTLIATLFGLLNK